MIWLITCGGIVLLLCAYGLGEAITGEDGWVAFGVGLVGVLVFVALLAGVLRGLNQVGL
jgi:hypothetical protein